MTRIIRRRPQIWEDISRPFATLLILNSGKLPCSLSPTKSVVWDGMLIWTYRARNERNWGNWIIQLFWLASQLFSRLTLDYWPYLELRRSEGCTNSQFSTKIRKGAQLLFLKKPLLHSQVVNAQEKACNKTLSLGKQILSSSLFPWHPCVTGAGVWFISLLAFTMFSALLAYFLHAHPCTHPPFLWLKVSEDKWKLPMPPSMVSLDLLDNLPWGHPPLLNVMHTCDLKGFTGCPRAWMTSQWLRH